MAIDAALGKQIGKRWEAVRYPLCNESKRRVIKLFTQSALTWILQQAGSGSRLVRCAVHCDEASPHVHIAIVCADEDRRLGWNRVRSRVRAVAGRPRRA